MWHHSLVAMHIWPTLWLLCICGTTLWLLCICLVAVHMWHHTCKPYSCTFLWRFYYCCHTTNGGHFIYNIIANTLAILYICSHFLLSLEGSGQRPFCLSLQCSNWGPISFIIAMLRRCNVEIKGFCFACLQDAIGNRLENTSETAAALSRSQYALQATVRTGSWYALSF